MVDVHGSVGFGLPYPYTSLSIGTKLTCSLNFVFFLVETDPIQFEPCVHLWRNPASRKRTVTASRCLEVCSCVCFDLLTYVRRAQDRTRQTLREAMHRNAARSGSSSSSSMQEEDGDVDLGEVPLLRIRRRGRGGGKSSSDSATQSSSESQ